MRTEKFDNTKPGYDTDDIKYAFEYNQLADRLNDIDVIVAEVCGANDELSWYWILQMKDGTYSWAEGSCDYTGWDCRSSAQIHDGFKTPAAAVKSLELYEYEDRKNIRECLAAQIKGNLPFAIYQEDAPHHS